MSGIIPKQSLFSSLKKTLTTPISLNLGRSVSTVSDSVKADAANIIVKDGTPNGSDAIQELTSASAVLPDAVHAEPVPETTITETIASQHGYDLSLTGNEDEDGLEQISEQVSEKGSKTISEHGKNSTYFSGENGGMLFSFNDTDLPSLFSFLIRNSGGLSIDEKKTNSDFPVDSPIHVFSLNGGDTQGKIWFQDGIIYAASFGRQRGIEAVIAMASFIDRAKRSGDHSIYGSMERDVMLPMKKEELKQIFGQPITASSLEFALLRCGQQLDDDRKHVGKAKSGTRTVKFASGADKPGLLYAPISGSSEACSYGLFRFVENGTIKTTWRITIPGEDGNPVPKEGIRDFSGILSFVNGSFLVMEKGSKTLSLVSPEGASLKDNIPYYKALEMVLNASKNPENAEVEFHDMLDLSVFQALRGKFERTNGNVSKMIPGVHVMVSSSDFTPYGFGIAKIIGDTERTYIIDWTGRIVSESFHDKIVSEKGFLILSNGDKVSLLDPTGITGEDVFKHMENATEDKKIKIAIRSDDVRLAINARLQSILVGKDGDNDIIDVERIREILG